MIDSIGGERTISVSLSIEPLQPRFDLSKASEERNVKKRNLEKVHILNVESK